MPIYEYECNGCGARHEFIQKFSESPKRKCPSCGKQRLRKLVSAAAFHLKGNGWYVTDFRDQKKPGDKSKGNGKSDGKGKAAVAGAGKDSKTPGAGKSADSTSKTGSSKASA